MKIKQPQCDKCGGLKFDIKTTDPKPSIVHMQASEYFEQLGGPTVSELLLRYSNYRATCKSCGATYDYTLMH